MEQSRLEEWLEAQAAWIEIKSLTPKARRDKVRLTRSLHTLSFLEVLLEAGASASAAWKRRKEAASPRVTKCGWCGVI